MSYFLIHAFCTCGQIAVCGLKGKPIQLEVSMEDHSVHIPESRGFFFSHKVSNYVCAHLAQKLSDKTDIEVHTLAGNRSPE